MNIDNLANRLMQMGLQGIGSIVGEFSVGVLFSYGTIWSGKKILQITLKKIPYQARPLLHTAVKVSVIFAMTLALLLGIGSSLAVGVTTGLTFSSLGSSFGPIGTSIGLISGTSLGVTLAVSIGIFYAKTIKDILSEPFTAPVV